MDFLQLLKQRTWTRDAACSKPPYCDIDFVGDGPRDEDNGHGAKRIAELLAICGTCPVREPCLRESMTQLPGIDGKPGTLAQGVWGGSCEGERRKALRSGGDIDAAILILENSREERLTHWVAQADLPIDERRSFAKTWQLPRRRKVKLIPKCLDCGAPAPAGAIYCVPHGKEHRKWRSGVSLKPKPVIKLEASPRRPRRRRCDHDRTNTTADGHCRLCRAEYERQRSRRPTRKHLSPTCRAGHPWAETENAWGRCRVCAADFQRNLRAKRKAAENAPRSAGGAGPVPSPTNRQNAAHRPRRKYCRG
jgi:Transcription factor WhiB